MGAMTHTALGISVYPTVVEEPGMSGIMTGFQGNRS